MTQHIADTVAAFARALPEAAEVLDVGCGLRPYEPLFAGRRYVGVDVESSGREAEGKHVDAWFDGVHLPFEDERFDGVICTQVLEHALEPDALLAEIRRVLRPGGRLLVTVPFLWGEHATPYDFRRYTSFGLERAVRAAGLEVVEHRRLQPGIATIQHLVEAEMLHDGPPRSATERMARQVGLRLWFLLLRLWRRTYRFERLFLDNALIARRD